MNRETTMNITFCDRCGLLTHERKRPDGSILCEDCYEGKRPKPSHAADSQEMPSVSSPPAERVLRTIQKTVKREPHESNRR